MLNRTKVLIVAAVTALVMLPQGVCVSADDAVPLSGAAGDDIIWEYDAENQKLTFTGSGKMYYDGIRTEDEPIKQVWKAYSDNTIEIEVSEGITNISDSAFLYFSNLQTVKLPDTLKSIDSYAFSNCTSLKKLTLPSSLEAIKTNAFKSSSLSSVVIPSSVTEIGGDAFVNTPWLSAKREKNPMVIVNHIIIDAFECTGKVSIPKGVVCIGDESFEGTSVSSVSIPSTVKEIGFRAFRGAFKLQKISMPDSVISCGSEAFADISTLTSIKLSKKLERIPFGMLQNTGITTVEIPDGVKTISEYAFENCPLLETVVISDSVETISYCAFNCDPKLVNLQIGRGVKCWEFPVSDLTIMENITFMNPYIVFPDKNFNTLRLTIESKTIYANDLPYNGTITGYEDSTAEAYAKKWNYPFVSLGAFERIRGDLDVNGEINIADAVLLSRLITEDTEVQESLDKAPILDINADNFVSVQDLAELLGMIQIIV